MMKKNYLWALLASMFFVGCSQNDDLPEGNENQEKELSYIAINVNATPSAGGRAAIDDGFVYGTADENKVKDACFFFFKSNGDPFNVADYIPTGKDSEGNDYQGNLSGVGGANWVKYTFNDAGSSATGNTNVEHKLATVLTLQGMTDNHPDQVVAVLGWQPANTTAVSLTELRKTLTDQYKNSAGYFIMSNSVYNNGTKNLYATQLTDAHFSTTPQGANAYPVTIYVERLAVRMGVSLTGATADRFKVNTEAIQINGEQSTTDVYVKILGWDINTTVDHSYLQKDIETSESWNPGLGFEWNDIPNFRSYWANTPFGTIGSHQISFVKSFDLDNFNTLSVKDYCLENTHQTNQTKIIVKAQLQDSGENPLSMAQWMGTYYNFDDLKGAVVAALSGNLYYRTTAQDSWTNIATANGTEVPGLAYVDIVSGDGDSENEASDYYKVTFKLADAGKTIQWSTAGTDATIIESTAVADIFAKLAYAKVWSDGYTYYYLDVEHLGNNKGVIRNHAYEIVINGVAGLGTPVYAPNGDLPLIPEPVIPEESETYLSAKINILSWALVSNNVTLQ